MHGRANGNPIDYNNNIQQKELLKEAECLHPDDESIKNVR